MESLQLKPGEVIYKCPKCCCIKPERAHHCRYGLYLQQSPGGTCSPMGLFKQDRRRAGQQSEEVTRCPLVFLARHMNFVARELSLFMLAAPHVWQDLLTKCRLL